jgi:adenine-specific DNA methylase
MKTCSRRIPSLITMVLVLSFPINGTLFAQNRHPREAQEEGAPGDSFDHDQKAKMEKERRDEAFQKLKEDSEKLYRATEELKEMIEKSNQHTFSLQIVKKTEEIEKILKDVKRRAREGS